MKLFVSPTSPYARKVRVLLHEKGLRDRVEETMVNPHQDPAELLARNPLGKIPVLALDDGSALYDSPVICEYLDAIDGEPSLIPRDGDARWAVLRAQALADGILDLAVATVMERARPESGRSQAGLERWRDKIERAAGGIGEAVSCLRGELDLGRIALAVALSYLDFRMPELEWRTQRPELIDWHANLAARVSMEATAPPRS